MVSKFPAKVSSPWLDLSLGILTAPVLVGLVMADQASRWLRDLSLDEQAFWLDERLPPLNPQQLAQRHPQTLPPDPIEDPDVHA
jgi:hypothetical protein